MGNTAQVMKSNYGNLFFSDPVSEGINTQTEADFSALGKGLTHHVKIIKLLYNLIVVWPKRDYQV